MCAIDGQPVLVGVTSWSVKTEDESCDTGRPAVYAEVAFSDHLNWITSLLEH